MRTRGQSPYRRVLPAARQPLPGPPPWGRTGKSFLGMETPVQNLRPGMGTPARHLFSGAGPARACRGCRGVWNLGVAGRGWGGEGIWASPSWPMSGPPSLWEVLHKLRGPLARPFQDFHPSKPALLAQDNRNSLEDWLLGF